MCDICSPIPNAAADGCGAALNRLPSCASGPVFLRVTAQTVGQAGYRDVFTVKPMRPLPPYKVHTVLSGPVTDLPVPPSIPLSVLLCHFTVTAHSALVIHPSVMRHLPSPEESSNLAAFTFYLHIAPSV